MNEPSLEPTVQLLLWLYSRTCCSWWSLEPLILCFQQLGWDGLQQTIHSGLQEIWKYSTRNEEFSSQRIQQLSRSLEELCDVLKAGQWSDVERCWEENQLSTQVVLTFLDSQYPEPLRTIGDPPPVLWCSKETSAAVWDRCLAVVGSRRSSTYGEKVTESIVQSLVREYDMCIVSGCAVGIDSAAHLACIKAGGITVGVLGVELSRVPARIQRLFSHENAVLVSEWPSGFGGRDWNFPRRNRLISGLSQGVLVVEAQEKSGTLLTVSSALEQGKDVFVVPHSIWSKNAAGIAKLANNGAKVVLNAADIVGEMQHQETLECMIPPLTDEECQLVEIVLASEGEISVADLSLARPATISSSEWWKILDTLQTKKVLINRMGIVSVQ